MEKRSVRTFGQYRLSAHKFSIETGRYYNVPRENRIYPLCHTDVEDEYHFIFICPFYIDLRKLYIKQYFWKRQFVYKLIQLFTSENVKELNSLGLYLNKAEKLRNNKIA